MSVYAGELRITGSTGVCFGGGNGGEGGYTEDTGSGNRGGNGGEGGSATFYGGTVTMSSEAACFGGGQGGLCGKDTRGYRDASGDAGAPVSLTVSSGATVKLGADEATAQTVSITETVTTKSDNETYKDKTFCEISFPTSATGSTLSEGSLWIIISVVVLAIGTVAALVVVKKKRVES